MHSMELAFWSRETVAAAAVGVLQAVHLVFREGGGGLKDRHPCSRRRLCFLCCSLSHALLESRAAEGLQGVLLDALGGYFRLSRRPAGAESGGRRHGARGRHLSDRAQERELRAAGLAGGVVADDRGRGGAGGDRDALFVSMVLFTVTRKLVAALSTLRHHEKRRAINSGDSAIPFVGGSALIFCRSCRRVFRYPATR